MADLITAVPPALAALKPYLLRASQFEKGISTDPKFGKVAYFLRYAAAQQGVRIIDTLSGPAQQQGNAFLMTLLDRLSLDKTNYAINSNEEAADLAFIGNYAGSLFKKADDADRAGLADAGTGQSFATAGFLFDVVRSLSPQAGDEAGGSDPRARVAKYAKGRATDILTALRSGQAPPPPAGGFSESLGDLGFDVPPAAAAGPSTSPALGPMVSSSPSHASFGAGGSEPMQGVSNSSISSSNTAGQYGTAPQPTTTTTTGYGVPLAPYPGPMNPGMAPSAYPSAAPTFGASGSSTGGGAGSGGSGSFGAVGQAVTAAISSGLSFAQNQIATTFGGPAAAAPAPANLGPSPVWAKLGGAKSGAAGAGDSTPLPAGKHGVSSAVMGDAMELTKHAMAALKEDDPAAAAAWLRQALALLPPQ